MPLYYDSSKETFTLNPADSNMMTTVSQSADGCYHEYYTSLSDTSKRLTFSYCLQELEQSFDNIATKRSVFLQASGLPLPHHMFNMSMPAEVIYDILLKFVSKDSSRYAISVTDTELTKLLCCDIRKWVARSEINAPFEVYLIKDYNMVGKMIVDSTHPIKVFEDGAVLDYHFYMMSLANKTYDEIVRYVGKGNDGVLWNIGAAVECDAATTIISGEILP